MTSEYSNETDCSNLHSKASFSHLSSVIENALNAELESSFEYYHESSSNFKSFTCFFEEDWVPEILNCSSQKISSPQASSDYQLVGADDSSHYQPPNRLEISLNWDSSAHDPIRVNN